MRMEFKGTKGDWKLYQKGDVPLGKNYSVMSIGQCGDFDKDICSVWHDQCTLSEAKFNALLISKAPEMLDMLKEIHDAAVDMGLTGRINHLEIEKLINSATTI